MQQISNLEGLGDIRAKLNSTGIHQQFPSVAALLASARPVPEGEYVGVPRLGHWYIGAASGASDHHLTNAYGSKLYVLPRSAGVYHFGAWGPDDTGVTNARSLFNSAVSTTVASATKCTLLMPGGRFLLGSGGRVYADMTRGMQFTLQGTGATILDQSVSGFTFRGSRYLTTALSADVDGGDIYATLADVTDVEVGDMLIFLCSDWIETGWKYDKVDVRRVVEIDGNTVMVNRPFRWPHRTTDTDHKVECCWPCEGIVDGVHFECASSSGGGVTFGCSYVTGGRISNGSYVGEYPKWTGSDFLDGPGINWSTGVHIDRFNIKNGRYCPKITSCADTVFSNSELRSVRHCDPNGWSENTRFENLRGVDTQGLIQSHPSTGNHYVNVHDSLDDSTLGGFDLRGLGETIESCSVISNAGVGVENTGNPLILEEYLPYCVQFDRRVSDFYAPLAVPSVGVDGQTFFERVHCYMIQTAATESYSRVFVSPDCVETKPSTFYDARDKSAVLQSGPVHVPLVPRWKTDGSVQTITGITQANPAVVTIAGHGYADGDVVWLWGGTMTQLQNYYTVTSSTTDTFQLTTLTGTLVDSTSYTAYSSDGKATKKVAADGIDANVYPAVGHAGKMHMVCKLASGEAGTFTKEFLYRPFTTGNVNLSGRHCLMTFRAATDDEFSETKIHYTYDPNGANYTPVEISSFDSDAAVLTIPVPTFTRHLVGPVGDEGGVNYVQNIGARYYIAVSVGVTATEAVDWLTVEIEDFDKAMLSTDLIR